MSSLFCILQSTFGVPLETMVFAACKLAAAALALRVVISGEPKFKDDEHPGIISGRGVPRPTASLSLQEIPS